MNKTLALLDRYFYLFMSLLIAVIVVYGFSHTLDSKLIHAVPRRPFMIYLHAAVFSGWVAFFILQSALVRMRSIRWHRYLGCFGIVFGLTIPIFGTSAAISIARFNIRNFHSTNETFSLLISFLDMAVFATLFTLAIFLRRKLELHRRLILIASCALTSAAFSRFPPSVLPTGWFYFALDVLIFLGVVRDLIFQRRVYRVYMYALPALALGQTAVMYATDWPYWLRSDWIRIGNFILR
jgi:hypothetical protein